MKKSLFLGFLVIVAVAGGILIAISNKKSDVALKNPIEEIPASNTAISEIPKPVYPPYAGQPILFFGSDPVINQLPPASVENYKKDLATMAEALRKNPYSFNDWLSVGIFKKFFNNYEGARDAWEYAAMLIPQQPVIHLNLANLYGYYLKDFPKAEKHYLEATRLDVINTHGALNATAGFYRDFGLKEKALEYYQRALQINPNDSSVKAEIERLSNG